MKEEIHSLLKSKEKLQELGEWINLTVKLATTIPLSPFTHVIHQRFSSQPMHHATLEMIHHFELQLKTCELEFAFFVSDKSTCCVLGEE